MLVTNLAARVAPEALYFKDFNFAVNDRHNMDTCLRSGLCYPILK